MAPSPCPFLLYSSCPLPATLVAANVAKECEGDALEQYKGILASGKPLRTYARGRPRFRMNGR
jgi:hypothetical protein